MEKESTGKNFLNADSVGHVYSVNQNGYETISKNVFDKGSNPKVLFIEPFYGGSHRQLIDILCKNIVAYTLVSLSSKKWHWRSRCGALCLSSLIPDLTTHKVLFCSSVLNLAELIGIRTDLVKLKKIIYFHENQLIYPVQEIKQRDIQYSYNQIVSCLAADVIVFNSNFNQDSFFSNIQKVIKLLPDYRPKQLDVCLRKKSRILYFPVSFPRNLTFSRESDNSVLKIVWPHRWEFDKGPDDFFSILFKLKSEGFHFKVAILGECFVDIPKIISEAKEKLREEIFHCGYIPLKTDYFKLLSENDVVISTSKHEFFGVSVLEAVYCGCFPLLPDDLVYPEIYPLGCLYKNLDDLYEKIKIYCKYPEIPRKERRQLQIDFKEYSSEELIPQYIQLLSSDEI